MSAEGRIIIPSTGEQFDEKDVVLIVSHGAETRDMLALREVLRCIHYLTKEEALRVLMFALDKTERRP